MRRRLAVVGDDVAEHPGGVLAVLADRPGEELEAVGVGSGQHVGLLHAGVPVDRAAVEVHALGEGVLQLGRGDGEGLELAVDVGEPEPDEPDALLLDESEDVVGALRRVGHARRLRGSS